MQLCAEIPSVSSIFRWLAPPGGLWAMGWSAIRWDPAAADAAQANAQRKRTEK